MQRNPHSFFLCLLLFFVVFFFFPLHLQNILATATATEKSKISIKSNVDKAIATTSEVIKFTVALSRPLEFSDLTLPEIGGELSGFRIVEFGEESPEEEEGLVILKKWYKLQADISGPYILPSVKLSYTDPRGHSHQLETSEIFVEIRPPVSSQHHRNRDGAEDKDTEEGEDIKDIKDLASIGPHPLWRIGVIVGLFGALVGIFIIFFLKFRKKKERLLPEIPPHELAIKALKGLEQASLDHFSDFKRYFFDLSDITRTYFENRFGLPATDRTTEELEFMVEKDAKDANDVNENNTKMQLFIHILKNADRVKFTDYLPTQIQAREALNKALHFVESTKIEQMSHAEIHTEEGSVI